MIAKINEVLAALAEGVVNVEVRFPDKLGEFEETASLLTQVTASMKDITAQANQIAAGNYTADIAPRGDKDGLGSAMQKMTATLRDVANIAETIATGAIMGAKVEIRGKDDLLASMNTMIEMLRDVVRQTDTLARGDYRAEIKPRSEQDVLGKALQAMTLTLRQASQVLGEVAAGNLDIATEVKGEQDLLANSVNSLIASMKKITAQANQIAAGNYTADIAPRSDKDELGIAMQKMTQSLRDVSNVAKQTAAGNYTVDFSPRGDNDELGISMQKMTQSLRNFATENERRDWLKTGQNELNKKMRGDQDETTLAQNVVTYLAKYIGAQIGALYVVEEESGNLKLMGSYAFSKCNLIERIQIGEGLVGQAAFEKEIISVTNLPDDYTRIGSAIGDAIPRNVVVSPFMHEGELRGVIELGAFREFSDTDMELLTGMMESIAISFNTARAAERMKSLLEETQLQAEELESQQEELRVSNKKLRAKTEQLERHSEELKRANENMSEQKTEIERKNREVEEKAEELAITGKYKSEFLANMSHELRTPLNSMLLLSNSLAKNRDGNLTQEQIKSATVIHKGGNDLLSLINEILDLSKIEAGMMEVAFRPVELREVADSVERNFRHVCEEKVLELKVRIDPNLPAVISTDPNRLGQILKNFMSNAIKFTSQGSITVEIGLPAPDVSLFRSGLEPKETVAFAVTDTGIGISADKMKVIFEAFQQANGGTGRKYGGTGLGLSISRELAALLGGEIQLKSRMGEGSDFTLYLPFGSGSASTHYAKRPGGDPLVSRGTGLSVRQKGRTLEDRSPIVKKSEAPIPKSEFQIQDDRNNLGEGDIILLLIEDDPKFAKILMDQCHNQDLKCLATSTGEEGLALADEYLPDGIILDIHLPGVNGWYVLNALKNNHRTRHIPVHIMSVDETDHDAARRGVIGFLTKPITQEQLEEALNKIITYSTKAVKDILVIEDDEATQKAIRERIGNSDVRITQALDSHQGIQALISGDFDCVILDLGLPDMSGFELLEQLMLKKDLRLPPIIIYTGKDLTREEHQQLIEYADSVIIKSVNSEERLLDETALFCHRVVERLPGEKQRIIHDLYDLETVFRDKKVMVVDDDMRNLFAVSQILQEKGISVLKADGGQRALDLLKQVPDVDLVLMDIMMPGMDGYETIRRIREQKHLGKLPIIALTAKAMKDDRYKCIAAGASDYLAKPVEEQHLFSMMRIWLYKG
ncbi:response regulator [Desulfobacterales bacterium HSG2]|nr:response regulator [Desulfobacterales bacterium HSG2]